MNDKDRQRLKEEFGKWVERKMPDAPRTAEEAEQRDIRELREANARWEREHGRSDRK